MITVISFFPFNNLVIILPKNKPIKQMPNVITMIIAECGKIVMLSDNPEWRATPVPKASIDVFVYSKSEI